MTAYYPETEKPDAQESMMDPKNFGITPKVNGHIHTPYSFSAFKDMEQPFKMAREEGVAILGINDFYTTDGYGEFASLAKASKVFPLFNIEFMSLQKEAQEAGIRINDPQNPGRTYLSGKGLRFPVSMSEASLGKIRTLQVESNRQTYNMVGLLNQFLETTSTGIRFDASELQRTLARNLFRERHIAAALRIAVFEKYPSDELRLSAFTEIFSGKVPKSALTNFAALENEIRNNLLKAGGPAFVPEDEKAFLSLEEVVSLIVDAGGIPCYPVLLDDPQGKFTEFEADYRSMADALKSKGIYMIELIPGRNDRSVLLEFVRFFDSQGFVITFGSEHNTPQLDPLTLTSRGNIELGEELEQINFRGAAIIAAHQYLTAQGLPGFPAEQFPSAAILDDLAAWGKKIVLNFIRE
jgi:hypothetical protein